MDKYKYFQELAFKTLGINEDYDYKNCNHEASMKILELEAKSHPSAFIDEAVVRDENGDKIVIPVVFLTSMFNIEAEIRNGMRHREYLRVTITCDRSVAFLVSGWYELREAASLWEFWEEVGIDEEIIDACEETGFDATQPVTGGPDGYQEGYFSVFIYDFATLKAASTLP